MPSIAEATRSHGADGLRRLVAGLGLVLVGAVLVGLGAAGTAGAPAPRTGLVIGGLALLGCLWVVGARIPLHRRERALAATGSTVAAASLLALWVLAPTGTFPQVALTVGAGLVYAIGLTVLLAAVLAGITLPGRQAGQPTSGSVAWTRSSSPSAGDARAADGGSSEDDLSFPLEDE